MIAINMISLYAKPSIGKTSGHNNRIYYDNHLSFLTFFISYYFWKIFPFLTTKGFGVYIVFLISVFVIPNIIDLNLFFENIGAEIDRFYRKIFTRELTGLGITMVKLQK